MSATVITPKTKESIYQRLLKDFLKGGNNYILKEYFELGKGWCKHEKHFQYLYLNLLCNFSCNIEYYFNQKMKEFLDNECPSNISIKDLNQKFNSTEIIDLVNCSIKDIEFKCNQ